MSQASFVSASLDLARDVVDGVDVWANALSVLDRFVGGDVLSVSGMTMAEQVSADLVTRGATALSDEELEMWPRLIGTHPYVPYLLTGPMDTSRLTDHVVMSEFERSELFQSLLRPHGNRFQAGLVLRRDEHRMLLLSVWREKTDFSDRELRMLEQFRAVVSAGVAFRTAHDDLLAATGVTHRRSVLTARQRQVAALVASGLTNDQIARRLAISPRTVRKHVGDAFAAVDVTSRAALAAWWRQGGASAT